jgi:hypothetical protein
MQCVAAREPGSGQCNDEVQTDPGGQAHVDDIRPPHS